MKTADLHIMVDRVLWQDWDPIGLNAMGGPDDEYRGYVHRIVRLLEDDVDCRKLADHLGKLAQSSMGLNPNRDNDEQAAAKLLACLNGEY